MTSIKNLRTDQGSCSQCGKPFTGVSSITAKNRPRPGDLTICFYCGHIMAYGDDLKVREMTLEEAAIASQHPDILENQKAIKLRKVLGMKKFV